MKNFLVFCFFFWMNCSCVGAPVAEAAERGRSEHISTGKILEFSLLHLRESLQKTIKKNDRLAFENDELRKSIQNLQRIQEALAVKRTEFSGEPASSDRQQKSIKFTGPVDGIKRRQRTQELIYVFERDIRQLEEKIRVLGDQLDEKRFYSEKQMLLERKKEGLNKLSRAEKRLKFLEKKNRAPLKTIETLTGEKNTLEQEIRVLEDRFAEFKE